MVVNRFDVFLVNLDPTIGSEIQKTRPCLIISPNEINHHIATVIVAPMTTKGQPYPTRVTCQFQGQNGQIVLDPTFRTSFCSTDTSVISNINSLNINT